MESEYFYWEAKCVRYYSMLAWVIVEEWASELVLMTLDLGINFKKDKFYSSENYW